MDKASALNLVSALMFKTEEEPSPGEIYGYSFGITVYQPRRGQRDYGVQLKTYAGGYNPAKLKEITDIFDEYSDDVQIAGSGYELNITGE